MPVKSSARAIAIVAIVFVAGVAALCAAVPGLQWRAKVIALKVSGRLPEVGSTDMLRWLVPGSAVYLGGLHDRPTVGAGIRNIGLDDAEYAKRGQEHYLRVCATCHGGDANGGSAPSLLAFMTRSTDWEFFSTVKSGRNGTAMAPQPVSERDIWDVHAFLRGKSRLWAREVAEHVA